MIKCEIKKELHDIGEGYILRISLEKEGEEIGFIRAMYWKDDGSIIIEDIDTHRDYRRHGLGELRLKEMLKLLDERKLPVGKVQAEGVSYIPETANAAQNFFRKYGFEQVSEEDWVVDSKRLKERLEISNP